MKAIQLKILPATNTKPTRLKAFDMDDNSIIRSGEDSKQNQIAIVKEFIAKFYGLQTSPNTDPNNIELDYNSFTFKKRIIVSGAIKQGSVHIIHEVKG